MPFFVRHCLWLSQLSLASLMVVGREALITLPPAVILLARLMGGAILFSILAVPERSPPLERRHYARLLLCAVFGATLNQACLLYGLQKTTAQHASVLSASIPVLTLVFATASGRERLSRRKLLGILLGLGGALALILFGRANGAGQASLTGDLLIGGNCIAWALFLILVADLARSYGPMFLASRLFIVGSILVFPFCIQSCLDYLPQLTGLDAGYLAYIICIPTVAAYACNQLAVRHYAASTVAIHWYLLPIFGVVGAAIRLQERIGVQELTFSALICAGILISVSGRNKPKAHLEVH